jgi:hypothetical protein
MRPEIVRSDLRTVHAWTVAIHFAELFHYGRKSNTHKSLRFNAGGEEVPVVTVR